MNTNICKEKNIVFISVGLSGGGSERVMSVLANKFVDKGMKVTFLLLKYDKVDYQLDNRIKIKKFIFSEGKKIIDQIRFIRSEVKKRNNCTVISFFTYQSFITLIATLGLKCKVIVSERNDPRKTVANRKVNLIRNFLYRFSNNVVFQTRDAVSLFPNYIQKKSVVISNPLKENLPQHYIGKRSKRFVAFSRLNKQKNIYMMIDACKKVFSIYDEYYLDIYGVGELKNDLEEYVKICGLTNKVKFKGFKKNIHEEIIDATAFLSSSDYEGVSNSMIEAMAIGLPCICTDCPIGGARMFINHNENGFLVEVNNSDDMANYMKKIIENSYLRDIFSKNAIKIKKELSSDKITKEWMKLL